MEHTPRILLVEDDPNFGDVLRSYLEMHNYDVVLAQDGVAGLEQFRKSRYDLCILDVMMPKKDGFTLGTEIRALDERVPLIFLTAKAQKEDVFQGFRVGADDYITKPFNSEELLLRIQAILKRSMSREAQEDQREEFEIGRFHFHYPLRMLEYREPGAEQKFKLSPKEAELLYLFCLRMNSVLTRNEALVKIWEEDNYFTARSMDVFITKLRKYLSLDDQIEIVNIHGNGFQLKVKDGASS